MDEIDSTGYIYLVPRLGVGLGREGLGLGCAIMFDPCTMYIVQYIFIIGNTCGLWSVMLVSLILNLTLLN